MQDVKRRASTGAGWWSRLADGSIRRVLAHRAADVYVCVREICSPEEEAVRGRLATPAAMTADELARDRALVAHIRCDFLRTPDPLEAFAFLGADDSARSALLEANPALTAADLPD